MSNKIVVLCTTSSQESANALAKVLVTEKLAACVNQFPSIKSTYAWEGKLEESTETMMLIKSSSELWDLLRARILELHSYDVPEIIALPIIEGHKPYLDWIGESTRSL